LAVFPATFFYHSALIIRHFIYRTYDFSTIGFRPFAETEEFVTIAVVGFGKRGAAPKDEIRCEVK
jgi:hypothetical protein